MNKDFHTYIKRAGEEVSLTHEERAKMKSVLHAYMAMKPVRPQEVEMSPISGWSMERVFASRSVAASLIVALFASTAGISYAAEGALPGDILYPIKTNINEPLRGAVALSVAAKTAWAMNVAGERIKEATTLATSGRLTPEARQEIQANFESHARQATENISRQANTSPERGAETAVRFEAQLAEYERVLTQAPHIGGDRDAAVNELASSVKAEREHVVSVRIRAGLVVKEREEQSRAAAGAENKDSGRKGKVNEESGQNRKEERKSASSTEGEVRYRAATTSEAKTRGTAEAAGSLSASSTGDGADKQGGLQTELDIKVEGEQQLRDSSQSVQSVLPAAVPPPTLP
ncbi:MAG: DUF5667 domain-containing protein [bacterium]|nr:DUF5667 domain-containing protein [bacterium]